MADRIEREIEEILRKLDNFVPDKPKKPARRSNEPVNTAQNWIGRSLARISLRQVMMWSLLVVLIAFFARAVPAATWVMVAALIVFVVAFLLSRTTGASQSSTQKRWRGQPLDLSGPSWPNRIKAFIKGRRRA